MGDHTTFLGIEDDGHNLTCTLKGNVLLCNGVEYVEKEEPLNYHDKLFWIYLGVYIALVLLAGIVSGLTMGLLSLDLMGLNVLANGGKPSERKYASKIIPIVKRHHLLLVTLLLTNAAAVESMPLFLDRISDPITAIAVSVTAVLLFGEVLPQAVCTRYGLAIGAAMAPMVKALMILTLPVSWPLSKVLDCVLGTEHSTFFRRAELSVLVDLHQKHDAENEDPLTKEEVLIISGALSMREKLASQAYTPLSKVFSIDINGIMDARTMEKILATGHSRIPIHEADKSNIIGILLVKRLIKLDPSECIPIRTVFEKEGREIPKISEKEHLYDLLNRFQNGKSHMCCVTATSGNVGEILGIITLEDVIEELIQEEILDETDLDEMRRISIVEAQFARRMSQYRASISQRGSISHHPRNGSLRRVATITAIGEEVNEGMERNGSLRRIASINTIGEEVDESSPLIA